MKEKKISIKASILWNTWGSLFYLGCQWLLSIVVVWISGVEASGLLSLAMTITNMFYSLAVYGMRTYQVADMENRFSPGVYVYSRVLTGGTSFLLCTVFVLFNDYGLQESLCILLYMLFRLNEIFFDVYAGFYQKHWRMDYMGKSMALRGLLMLVSFCGMLYLTGSLSLTFLVMAMTTFASLFFYDRKRAESLVEIKKDFDFSQIKKLLIICFPLVIYLFLNTAVGSIPRYFLEKMRGQTELGIYAAIASPTLVVQMAASYIFNPFVTAFAEKYHVRDDKGFFKLLKQCIVYVGMVAVGAVIGVLLLGKWGLGILFSTKPEIVEHANLLLPLVFCTILTAFSWLLCGVLTVIKDFKGLIIGNITAVLVCTISSMFFINRAGMQGASYAFILALGVEIVLLFWFLLGKMRE